MDAATFERVKKVLIEHGWFYYPLNDQWSTGDSFNDSVITNSFLLFHFRNVTSICYFFSSLLKKPELCSPVLSVLPDRYFEDVEFETCA